MSHRVLIVEDDRDFAAQLAEMIRFRGHHPVVAESGPEGLAAFESERPDLVLVDVMLPEIHGLRVLEQIRALPHGADVPAMLMSAVYGNGDLFQADIKRLALLGFIGTPLSLTDVGQELDDILASEDNGRARVRALGPVAAAQGQQAPSPPRAASPASKDVSDAPDVPASTANSTEGFMRAVAELRRTRASGNITLHSSGAWRRIILVEGLPSWVEVSDTMDGLPRFLVETKVLSISTMRELSECEKAQQGDMAGALADLDVVKAAEIDDVLKSWVSAELRRGLSHEGRFEYQASTTTTKAGSAHPVDPFTTLWDGLTGNVAQEAIDDDLSGLANETIRRSSIYAQVSDSLSEIPALARLAQEVDHPRNIEDLRLLLGDPDGETSRAFWFLLTTGILELTDEAPSSRQRGGVGHGAPASSESASKAAPVAERMRAPATGMEHQVQFELKSSKQDEARDPSESPAPARDPVGTVRLDYINKMTSDHYGFLEIDRAALGTDIDSAYQDLAPRYRRQSLPDDVDDETKRMAKELLARLVSVYEELSEPARRARYDLLGPERHQTKTTAEGPEKAASDDVPTADDIPADAGEGQTQQPEEPDATASGAGKRPAPATAQGKNWADELRWYPGCEDPTQVRQRSAQLDAEDAALLLQAHELMGQQKFKKAFGLLDGLRERDPSNSGLLADLGWCRFAQDTENERNVIKALEWVDLALAFDPGYRDALEAKARILCRCGADQQVIPVLQSLVGVDPDLKWAEDELALRKEAKEAEEAAQQKGGLRSLLGRKG